MGFRSHVRHPQETIRIILLFTFLFFFSALQAQHPYIRQLTNQQGLPSRTIYKTISDREGFIWMATDNGIARFDGSDFKYFRKQQGLSSNEVVNIKQDSRGRIWAFLFNGRLEYIQNNRVHTSENTPWLKELALQDVYIDFCETEEQEMIFFSLIVPQIIVLDKDNQVKKLPLPTLPDKAHLAPLWVRKKNGEYTIYTRNRQYRTSDLSKLEPVSGDTTQHLVLTSQNSNDQVLFFYRDSRSNRLSKLIVHSKSNTWEINLRPLNFTSIPNCALFDMNGVLWLGTLNNGIYCYRGSRLIHHLPINVPLQLYQDKTGYVWVSTANDGIYQINKNLYEHVHYGSINFGDEILTSLNPGQNGAVFGITYSNLYRLKNGKIEGYPVAFEGFNPNQLAIFGGDNAIIGEASRVHYYYKLRQGFKPERIKRLAESSVIKSLSFNSDSSRLVSYNKDNIVLIDLKEKGFPGRLIHSDAPRIFHAYFNADNDLIANRHDNVIFDQGELVPYPPLNFLKGRILYDHINMADRREVFNVEGSDVYVTKNHRPYRLEFDSIVKNDFKFQSMTTSGNVLFVATNEEVFTVELPDDLTTLSANQYDQLDLRFNSISDILATNDTLYISSKDGLTLIPRRRFVRLYPDPPKTYIKSIEINNVLQADTSRIFSIIGKNNIRIQLGSIDYSTPHTIYAYRMSGMEDWSILDGNNLMLSNLKPAYYEIQVKSSSGISDWSAPVSLKFHVKIPFWQQPLFLTLITLGLAMVGLGIYVASKNAKIRKKEMQQEILRLEQKALQTMMSPHFTFNALSAIEYFLLKNQPAMASKYLSRFANLIRRYMTAFNAKSQTIEEEINLLTDYIEIEKLRTADQIDFRITTDVTDPAKKEIPAMLIQPFVENAIWHGLGTRHAGGFVHIHLSELSNKLIKIVIDDNGVGMKNTARKTERLKDTLNMSSEIAKKRIQLLDGSEQSKTGIQSEKLTDDPEFPGTRVTLITPYV